MKTEAPRPYAADVRPFLAVIDCRKEAMPYSEPKLTKPYSDPH